MSKITQLTTGQERRLREVYEEWLAVGRSCEPLNRAEAAEIIGDFYARIGKPRPAVLIFSSPIMCVLAHGVLRAMAKDGSQLWSQIGSQLWSYIGGNNWCAWEVFYAFCGEIGVRYTSDEKGLLDLWLRQSRGLHWWFPYDSFCLVSERHTSLHVDSLGRLHNESGIACGYSDGWGIHAWHGTRVPAEVIEQRDKITVKQIIDEKNTEVRRVMRNLYGNDRFMLEAGAKEVDRSDKHGARLLALQLPGDPVEIRMAELTCPSTGHKFFERVPPDCKSAIDALSWRFNVKPSEYRPQWET